MGHISCDQMAAFPLCEALPTDLLALRLNTLHGGPSTCHYALHVANTDYS